MTDPARRPATYHDVLDAPATMVAEVIDGELYLNPRPSMAHAAVATALSEELGPPFKRGRGGPGGWLILFEPELHFGEQTVVPDLAGWRRERMPSVAADQPWTSLAPDWLCEVISPGTRTLDRKSKLPLYAREGVRHLWLIDPLARMLELYRLESSKWVLLGKHCDDDKVRAEPFEALALDLAILWADVRIA